MKTITILLSGIFLAVFPSAHALKTNPDEIKETGIIFHQGTWNEALQLAKKEGKPIFLDVYASWCGPCKMLKTYTFPNQEVGKFFNANFINVAVDGEKGEGPQLAQKFNLRGYPTLIFVDSNEQVIAQKAGYRNAKKFIELGQQVIDRLDDD